MIVDSKWLDSYGNMKFNSWDANSENPSTANALFSLLAHKAGRVYENFNISQLNANKHLTNGGIYLTNEHDIDKVRKWEHESGFDLKIANFFKLSHMLGLERSPRRFSHDEMNSIASTSYYFMQTVSPSDDYNRHVENLDILNIVSGQSWYRYYDCGSGIQYAKGLGDKYILRNRIEYFATNSFNSTKKDARGEYHASGKCQAWIRIVGLGLDLEKCTKDMPEVAGLVTMFSNFIPERSHPINVMAREVYS